MQLSIITEYAFDDFDNLMSKNHRCFCTSSNMDICTNEREINMLSVVLSLICIASVVYGVIRGRMSELSAAVLDGASGAVSLTLTLCGSMCLWCGIMELLSRAGAMRRLAHFISPLLRIFFPDAYRSGCATEEIAANISANILGIGNAATPYALAAMKKLAKRAEELGIPTGTASDDMITLAVLNTSSVSLIPTTVCALRRAAGASQPFLVVPAVWICSAVCATMAVVLARCMALPRANTVRKPRRAAPQSSPEMSHTR